MTKIELLVPDWAVDRRVRAYSTTRLGGVSRPPWDSLNLATHVGDDARQVARNRTLLREALQLPAEPGWLQQVHGTDVAEAGAVCQADAAFSRCPGEVCVVMTADCLPVLFAQRDGAAVAAAHAGWRGLVAGVLEQTLARFDDPAKVCAWLGPAIGPTAFEVGEEVREAFVAVDLAASSAFHAGSPGHWYADLFLLARQRLQAAGVEQISGGGICTYSEPSRFYSYRRDGETGRMASLIWIDDGADDHRERGA